MDDPSLTSLFLLDREGRIRWRAKGYAEEGVIIAMKYHISRLLTEKDR